MAEIQAIIREEKADGFQKLREAVSIGKWIFGHIKDAVSVDPFRVHADDLHGVTGIIYVRLKQLREILQYRFRGGFLLPFHALKLSGRLLLFFLAVTFFPIACVLVLFEVPAVLPKAVMLRHKPFRQLSGMQQIVTAADNARLRQDHALISEQPRFYKLRLSCFCFFSFDGRSMIGCKSG